jgi:hypothetical protein
MRRVAKLGASVGSASSFAGGGFIFLDLMIELFELSQILRISSKVTQLILQELKSRI